MNNSLTHPDLPLQAFSNNQIGATIMKRIEIEVSNGNHHSRAYSLDNGKVWRWCSNDRVIPIDVIGLYKIDCDIKAHKEAYDKEISEFLKEYRESRNNGPSDEERAEARAAHGPGVTLVDVFTGQEWIT